MTTTKEEGSGFMKLITILQAGALALLALYGASAGAEDRPACTTETNGQSCDL